MLRCLCRLDKFLEQLELFSRDADVWAAVRASIGRVDDERVARRADREIARRSLLSDGLDIFQKALLYLVDALMRLALEDMGESGGGGVVKEGDEAISAAGKGRR